MLAAGEDALIVRIILGVRKEVKWNSRLYGGAGQGWFPGIHLLHEVHRDGFLPRHVAASCPRGKSKSKDTRYLDIREDDPFDEAQFAAWVKQASQLPGEHMRVASAKCIRGASGRQVISPAGRVFTE